MKTVSAVKRKPNERTRLQRLHDDSGLSLREIAKFSGVSVATISRVAGGKPPDIRTSLRLARFFETTVEDLFSEFSR